MLNKHKCYLIDMNGVLTDITKPVEKAVEFIDYLNKEKISYYILTNNSMKHPEDFVVELEELGIYGVKPENFITSSMVTANYLKENHNNEKIYLVGEKGIVDAVNNENLTLTTNPLEADLCVMGLDSEVDYNKLCDMCIVAQKTNKFIVTNSDYKFPKDGYIVPGNGTFRLAIESVTGVKAINLGKPKSAFFKNAIEIIQKKENFEITDFAMIGDNLQTDILGANNFNIDSIHVLTGVHNENHYDEYNIYPKYTLNNLEPLFSNENN